MTVEYKGYQLHPDPSQAGSGSGWSARVVIEHLAVDDAEDFVFASGEVFETAKQAEDAAIALGKQIVDGQHPEFRLG
jgi:hypothetical protein